MAKTSFLDLIDQTFYFPQENFELRNGVLHFHGVDLSELIEEYGTPLKLTYLPSISRQIQKAKSLFNSAIEKHDYQGRYLYTYCTKSNHFKLILDEVMKNKVHLETSSSFDMDLLGRMLESGSISEQTKIVCNGYKPKDYLRKISQLINQGHKYVTPVIDNHEEVDFYLENITAPFCNIGLRVATEEEPNFEFYTSRLGVRHADVPDLYKEKIAPHSHLKLRMLHFFVDTGIKDTIYYWQEFKKGVQLYCELSKICPTLEAINIGGGLPIRNSLGAEYDYEYMISEIVLNIKQACDEAGVKHPDIFTEFGTFTVGESGAAIFSVLGQKKQNDSELWYMIDNSLMTTLPDTWGINQRFITLPINKWENEPTRINIGGITCDNSDYYNAEYHVNQLYLPCFPKDDEEPLYIGFFHTGAYQENISGYGGIKHCLIPSPQHIYVTEENGEIKHWQSSEQQKAKEMLRILGYG